MNKEKNYNWLLWIILGGAFALNFSNIGIEGYSNLYYTVTVKSMLTSFHNWFFAAYDPAGFVTVDKPPLAFWVQSLFVAVFGLHGWAIILPSALAGTVTVFLCYKIVRMYFKEPVALLTAVLVATTPVFVAVNRNNTPDAILLLFITTAVYFLSRAIDTGKKRYVFATALFVALGFNTKFLMAFAILPAVVGGYLVYAKSIRLRTRILRLSGALIVMMAVSFAWVIAVDSTSASDRPFVGGSSGNREMELLIGFNGVARVLPQTVLERVKEKRGTGEAPGPKDLASLSFFDFEMGRAGALRLFNDRMIDQINWFFPLLAIGAIVLALSAYREKNDRILRFVLLCLLWILPCAAIMSVTVLSHRYYLSFIAPPMAMLTAAGGSALWTMFKNRSKHGYMLLVAFIANSLYALLLMPDYHTPFSVLLKLGAVIGLVFSTLVLTGHWLETTFLRRTSVRMAATALLALPFLWSITPALYGTHDNLPYAAPSLYRPPVEQMTPDEKSFYNGMKKHKSYPQPALENYLIKNHRNERFLAAVPNALIASPLMLNSTYPVMAMGGFVGRDPILTPEALTRLAEAGEVSYFVTSEPFKMLPEVDDWIKSNCTEIEEEQWRPEIPPHIEPSRIDEVFGEDYRLLLTKSLSVYRYNRDDTQVTVSRSGEQAGRRKR